RRGEAPRPAAKSRSPHRGRGSVPRGRSRPRALGPNLGPTWAQLGPMGGLLGGPLGSFGWALGHGCEGKFYQEGFRAPKRRVAQRFFHQRARKLGSALPRAAWFGSVRAGLARLARGPSSLREGHRA